jgi:hypothetical protein
MARGSGLKLARDRDSGCLREAFFWWFLEFLRWATINREECSGLVLLLATKFASPRSNRMIQAITRSVEDQIWGTLPMAEGMKH